MPADGPEQKAPTGRSLRHFLQFRQWLVWNRLALEAHDPLKQQAGIPVHLFNEPWRRAYPTCLYLKTLSEV
jgi:hypothetical protein